MIKPGELLGIALITVVFMALYAMHAPAGPSPTATPAIKDSGYLRVPVKLTEPTATATPVVFWANISFYSCSLEEGTADCVEHHTGDRPRVGTAASPNLPVGTVLRIWGDEYIVRDFCGGCEENGLDLYVESRGEAFQLGRKIVPVTIE